LTSALDRGEWPTSRPGRFTPRGRAPGTHWILIYCTKIYYGRTWNAFFPWHTFIYIVEL